MQLILKYFPDLDREQVKKFTMLEALYREWNEKINVISRKDIDHLYEHHVLHSLAIAKIIRFKPGTKILDVGTGGGFPGIPLAIINPESHFTLNDSIEKKIRVVNVIVAGTGLMNVKTLNMRAEEIREKFDFIVSRAVTSFPVFHKWVGNKILSENKNDLSNGILYLKGGEIQEEFRNFINRIRVYDLDSLFSEEFFITKKLVHFS